MPEFMKVRLTSMIDNEIKQVIGEISNNNIWLDICVTRDEQRTIIGNIVDLEEYLEVLRSLKKQMEEGELNV